MTGLMKSSLDRVEFARKLGRYFRVAALPGLMFPLFAQGRFLLQNRRAQASGRYSIRIHQSVDGICMLRKETMLRPITWLGPWRILEKHGSFFPETPEKP